MTKAKPKAEQFFEPGQAGVTPTPRAKAPASTKAAKTKAQDGIDVRPPLARRAIHVDSEVKNLTADAGIVDDQKKLRSDIERIRKIRKPFGSMTQKLALPKRPGYHTHWFNDEPGRVEDAAANGWAHRTGKDGKPVSRVVGRGRDSGALYAYAMDLPMIFWQEDMDARHDVASARIDEIRKKPFQAQPGMATKADVGKFYDPTDSGVVKIKQTVARAQPSGE